MTRPSFGLHISRGSGKGFDFSVEQVRTAKEIGLDSIWVADHLNGFPAAAPVFEPFTVMGYLAREAPGLRVGLAATDPFRRHPALLAQSFSTIAAMTGKAPILTLGSGEGQNIVPWGWEIERPLRRVKETTQVMKALYESSPDHTVTMDTDRFHLKEAFLQMEEGTPRPSIHFAANGPLMRKMIGRYADGWVPMMLRPEMIAEDLKDIHANAIEVGRSPDDIEVVYWTSLGIAGSRQAGLDKIKGGAKRQLLAYPSMAARLGAEITDEHAYRDLVIEKDNEGPVNAAAAEIPDSAVEGTGIYGTEADCLEMIDGFVDAGVDHFVLRCTNTMAELSDFVRHHLHPHLDAKG